MLKRRYDAVFCLRFQENVVAEKESKMLELETLFMLVNILSYAGMAPDFLKMGKALFLNIFKKIFKFYN